MDAQAGSGERRVRCSCGVAVSSDGTTAGAERRQQWLAAWSWRNINTLLYDSDLARRARDALLRGPSTRKRGVVRALECTAQCAGRGARGACLDCRRAMETALSGWEAHTYSGDCSLHRIESCTVPQGWFIHIPSHWWHGTLNVAAYNAFVSVFVR